MTIDQIMKRMDEIEQQMHKRELCTNSNEKIEFSVFQARLIVVSNDINQLYSRHVISPEDKVEIQQYWANLIGGIAYDVAYEQARIYKKALQLDAIQERLKRAKEELISYCLNFLQKPTSSTMTFMMATTPSGWLRVHSMNATYRSIQKKNKSIAQEAVV